MHPFHRLAKDRARLLDQLALLERSGAKLVTWIAFEGCCLECHDRANTTCTIAEVRALVRTPFCRNRERGCRCELEAR